MPAISSLSMALRTRGFVLAWFAVVVLSPPFSARAAERAASLVRLVGEEAGLAIEVTDLKSRLPAARDSEFACRFAESDFYQAWLQSDESQKLARIGRVLERITGKSMDELSVDLFGKSVVMAFYPNDTGESDHIIITEAASRDVLRSMIDSWNRSGRQTTEAIADAGGQYFRRTRTTGDGDNERKHVLYYAVLGPVFALSEHESLVRRTVERDRRSRQSGGDGAESVAPSLADAPAFAKARSALSPDSLVTAYCNPRAWKDAGVFGAMGVTVKKLLAPFEDKIESAAVGLRVEAGPVAEAVVHLKSADLPRGLARLATTTSGVPAFLEKAPRRAVAVVAGRSRPDWLGEFLVERFFGNDRSTWENSRQTARGLMLGLDPIDDVLPAMGENWGAYIVPPIRPVEGSLPVDGLIALAMPAESTPEKLIVRQALDNAAATYLNLLAALTNTAGPAKPAVVRTENAGGLALRWLENYGSYELSCGITEKHFLIATSPVLIREFHAPSSEERLVSAPEFEGLRTRYFPDDNHVLFVDVAGVRRLLGEHREDFIAHGVNAKRVPAETARQQLQDFARALQILDTAFVAGRVEGGRVKLVVGGTAADQSSTPSAP